MKSCGCTFCNDLRNIEPAKYIGSDDEELQNFVKKLIIKRNLFIIIKMESIQFL